MMMEEIDLDDDGSMCSNVEDGEERRLTLETSEDNNHEQQHQHEQEQKGESEERKPLTIQKKGDGDKDIDQYTVTQPEYTR